MSVEVIGVILAILGIYAMTTSIRLGVYMLCLCTLLGAAAALKLPSVGGANIQPFHFVLLFLAAGVALRSNILAAALSSLRYPGPGFWFVLFALYSVLTAIFLPRMFADATIVYSLARGNEFHRILSTPLAPSASNLTQAVYMLGSIICFAIVAGLGRLGQMTMMARALIVTGAVCIVFAIADLVTYQTNTTELLSIIRNANYRMLNDGDIAGFKRIVGSFPEAGAFGYVALALFAFTLMLALERFPGRFLGSLVGALAVALLLCTSTTAYVASAIIALIVLVFCATRILRRQANLRHLVYIAVCLFAIPLLVMVVLLIPSVSESIGNLLHATLTTKLESQSGEERMRWNVQAINSFLETSGMGAGLGSIRASSFLVALLANIGILGSVLFFIFLFSLVRWVLQRRGAPPQEQAIGIAALLASVAQVAAASISAGVVDLGPLFMITAGLATAYALGPAGNRAGFADGVQSPDRSFVLDDAASGFGVRRPDLPIPRAGAVPHV